MLVQGLGLADRALGVRGFFAWGFKALGFQVVRFWAFRGLGPAPPPPPPPHPPRRLQVQCIGVCLGLGVVEINTLRSRP